MDDGETCLVHTVDFFTPVVDDPYDYGRISAANSLSDIYAMGARPLSALSIVAFPIGKLGPDVLAEIMQGALSVTGKAGIPVIGGHSIDDAEPKFGLAVTGMVKRDNIVSNAGARPGDVLLLTKPLGSGIYTTAIKQEKLAEEKMKAVVGVMTTLNKKASEAMVSVGVNAATDVTGFGMIGHLREMMLASGVSAMVTAEQVPCLPDLEDLIMDGCVPGGTANNLAFANNFVDWSGPVSEPLRYILCDAQTSGGLIISCPPHKREELQEELRRQGLSAPAIGVVFDGPAGALAVVS
jgi:selenide,water dikinase